MIDSRVPLHCIWQIYKMWLEIGIYHVYTKTKQVVFPLYLWHIKYSGKYLPQTHRSDIIPGLILLVVRVLIMLEASVLAV